MEEAGQAGPQMIAIRELPATAEKTEDVKHQRALGAMPSMPP